MKTKILNVLLLLFSAVCMADSNNTLLDSANGAYAKNKFVESIKYYDKILAGGYESAEIYYNIGNAHYKNRQLALAILYYEKAKKLSPADEDINYNLKLVNEKLVDKIEVLPQLFIKDWWNSFLSSLSEKTGSMIGIVLFWLGFFGLFIYFVSRRRLLKQIGFGTATVAFLFSFLVFFVTQKSSIRNSTHTNGIVLSLSVNIKGSPSEQGTDLFVLHEGTKVGIEQRNENWTEIKIPNGNRGWIKSSDLGII